MSAHPDNGNEGTHPLLWAAALIGFCVVLVAWFGFWMNRGELIGRAHPPAQLESSAAGEPDHAALIASMDEDLAKMGKEVYNSTCVSCHGPDGGQGPDVRARKFAEEPLLNGNDPYSMYKTLDQGFNMMPAQTSLSAEEKYAVIHYIRQEFVAPNRPDELTSVTAEYLAGGEWPPPSAGAGEMAHPRDREQPYPVIGTMALMAAEYEEAIDARRSLRRTMIAAIDGVEGGKALARRIAGMSLAELDAFVASVDGDDLEEAVAVATGVRGGGLEADLALFGRERWRVLISAIASRDRLTLHLVHPEDSGNAAP